MNRYHRQMLLPGVREAGQRMLGESHALIVGCGALGCVIADSLTRAGIGQLTIVDRDVVELTNLQRQILYDESDVAAATPKAIAAMNKLTRVNSEIRINAVVDDFNHRNADRFVGGVDVILDGLDNFETRYLLNDLSVMRHVPYIYGGAVGTTGMSMTILPHEIHRGGATSHVAPPSHVTWDERHATPCLRCIFPEAPPPGVSPTCDTAGVLGPLVSIIGAHQAVQAIKLLTGNIDALDRLLLSIDVWSNESRRFDVSAARNIHNQPCPCCVLGQFQFYEGAVTSGATSLCGRKAVQVAPNRIVDARPIDLPALAARLSPHGQFEFNGFLLRGQFAAERNGEGEPIELTLFADGRAIIKGTSEVQTARAIYAKYIGA